MPIEIEQAAFLKEFKLIIIIPLLDFNFHQFFTVRVGNVHRASDTRIETVNGAKNFDGLLSIIQGMVIL